MTVDHHARVTQQQAAPPPFGGVGAPMAPTSAPPSPGPPPAWPAPPAARRRPPIVASLALIVAIAALVAVIIDITRSQDTTPPPPAAAAPAAPTYTTEQINAAKQQTCTAAERSIAGVRVATNRPGLASPDDPLGWANTANARVALLAAAVHLPQQVDAATPQDVKNAVNSLTLSAGDAVSAALTDGKYAPVPAGEYEKAIEAFNAASKEVQGLCQA